MWIDKLSAQLAYPVSLALCLVVAAFIALLLRRRVWVAGFLLVGAGWLGFWSLPVMADALLGSLEAGFGGQSMAVLPGAEVAVVLGGALRLVRWTDPAGSKVRGQCYSLHSSEPPFRYGSSLCLEFPGALYHSTAHGNGRQPSVADDTDRQRFVDALARENLRCWSELGLWDPLGGRRV